jgi:hypothetical protein
MAGGGFEQCYNGQAAVAAGSLLVVAIDVVLAANDKQQLEPMICATLFRKLFNPGYCIFNILNNGINVIAE